MVDAIFAHPRLAAIYDALDANRSDLDLYARLVTELAAQSVLDVGCGTGVWALLLAECGVEVVGVDPAEASLYVARAKPGADRVRWILGDATAVPPLEVDAATMTGNVAQAIADPTAWEVSLESVAAALSSSWLAWSAEASRRSARVGISQKVAQPVRQASLRAPAPRPATGSPCLDCLRAMRKSIGEQAWVRGPLLRRR